MKFISIKFMDDNNLEFSIFPLSSFIGLTYSKEYQYLTIEFKNKKFAFMTKGFNYYWFEGFLKRTGFEIFHIQEDIEETGEMT